MNNFIPTLDQSTLKFKQIFRPYLIITMCTVVLYTLLNWLLIIKLELFKIDDSTVNLLIPMILPWIPNLIWLRPRIKLLNLNRRGRNNPVMGILLLNWMSIGIPLIITQSYMVSATGKLTALNYIGEIRNTPATMYYTAQSFHVSKNLAHGKFITYVSGKSNSDFNMDIYVAVPVFNHIYPDTNRVSQIRDRLNVRTLVSINEQLCTMQQLKKLPADSIRYMQYYNPSFAMLKYDTAGRYGIIYVITKGYKLKKKLPVMKIEPPVWLALKYSRSISNSSSVAEKKESCKDFAIESNINYQHLSLDKFTYLERLPYNHEIKNYTAAIKSRNDVTGDDPIILLPKYTPFADRNGNKLVWIFVSFAIGSFIFIMIVLSTSLRNNEETVN